MDRFTVLGGGGPFTIGLIEALLAAEPSLPPLELFLYGRRRAHLDLVREYAAWRLDPLGWEVGMSTDLREALIGARFILHQIRYGGVQGRAEDEELSAGFGTIADETLGPGALNAALRMAPALRGIAATISATAPQAWVLNLTNPLSVAVSILVEEGMKRCIGLCELPSTTARIVARMLDVPLEQLDWHYRGLNHRGFIVSIARGDVDQFPSLLRRLGKASIGGIPATIIKELGAIPTKYYRLLQQPRSLSYGRARFVSALRDRILRELQASLHATPPSLRRRALDWYGESVVPTLAALHAAQPCRQVVNLRCSDGLTRELHALVSAEQVVPELPPQDLPPRVHDLLVRFEEHERFVLEAVSRPSPESIRAAIAADPAVERSAASALADTLWRRQSASAIEVCDAEIAS